VCFIIFNTLQDVIIITITGKVIASRIIHPKIQEQEFGMLFSALNSFSKEMFNSPLLKIEMHVLRLELLQQHNLIFIATSSLQEDPTITERELRLLADYFFSKFSPDIAHSWNGALNIFVEFENELQMNESLLS
jgi:hypothetical protein